MPSVLVVDDDPDIRSVIAYKLGAGWLHDGANA